MEEKGGVLGLGVDARVAEGELDQGAALAW